jgi:hypothetical protein
MRTIIIVNSADHMRMVQIFLSRWTVRFDVSVNFEYPRNMISLKIQSISMGTRINFQRKRYYPSIKNKNMTSIEIKVIENTNSSRSTNS